MKRKKVRWKITTGVPEGSLDGIADVMKAAVKDRRWEYLVLVRDPAKVLSGGLWTDLMEGHIQGEIVLREGKGVIPLPDDIFCDLMSEEVAAFIKLREGPTKV